MEAHAHAQAVKTAAIEHRAQSEAKSVGIPSFGHQIMFTQGSVTERRFAAVYGRRGRIVGAVTFDHGKWLQYYGGLIERSAPFPIAHVGYDLPADMSPISAEFPDRRAPATIPDVVLTGHNPGERGAEFRHRDE